MFNNKKIRIKDDSFRIVNPPITNENIKQLSYKIRCPNCKRISEARFQIYEGDVLKCVQCFTYLEIRKVEQIGTLEIACSGNILNPNSQYVRDIKAGKYRHLRIDNNEYFH